MNKKLFKTKDAEGNELELAVRKPTVNERHQSQLEYNKAWKAAEAAGSIIQFQLDTVAERQGLWGDTQRKRVAELEQLIPSLERKLRGGHNNYENLESAKGDALEIRKLRNERLELLLGKNNLYSYTAEYHADTARINYLLSVAVINPGNGAQYFSSMDTFINVKDAAIGRDALQAYAELMQADVPDETSTLYENQWLLKYNFVDSKYRLVNSDGKLVTEDGLLIDEDGRYVNEEGSYTDKSGHPVDKEGNYIVDYKEF